MLRSALRPSLALVFVLVLVAAACGTDEDESPDDDGAADTTTTTTTTTTTAPAPEPVPAVWPAPETDPFPTAEDAALDFAREYLGMPDASLADPTPEDAADTIGIRTYADRGPTTVVEVEDRDGGWVVTGASSDMIVVSEPSPGAPLLSPLGVSGEGTAFEGTLHVEVRQLGETESIASEFTTGGAQGEMGAFETTLDVDTDDAHVVLVVFAPDASGMAEMSYATVLLLG